MKAKTGLVFGALVVMVGFIAGCDWFDKLESASHAAKEAAAKLETLGPRIERTGELAVQAAKAFDPIVLNRLHDRIAQLESEGADNARKLQASRYPFRYVAFCNSSECRMDVLLDERHLLTDITPDSRIVDSARLDLQAVFATPPAGQHYLRIRLTCKNGRSNAVASLSLSHRDVNGDTVLIGKVDIACGKEPPTLIQGDTWIFEKKIPIEVNESPSSASAVVAAN